MVFYSFFKVEKTNDETEERFQHNYGGKTLYTVFKVKKYDIVRLLKVVNILYYCGKDMARKSNLHHWNIPRIKMFLIVVLYNLSNDTYLIYDGKIAKATFQVKTQGDAMAFQKLATTPQYSGGGLGTFCLQEIERIAKAAGCKEVICDVYDKNTEVKTFYEKRGYYQYDTGKTRNFTILKLKKEI